MGFHQQLWLECLSMLVNRWSMFSQTHTYNCFHYRIRSFIHAVPHQSGRHIILHHKEEVNFLYALNLLVQLSISVRWLGIKKQSKPFGEFLPPSLSLSRSLSPSLPSLSLSACLCLSIFVLTCPNGHSPPAPDQGLPELCSAAPVSRLCSVAPC